MDTGRVGWLADMAAEADPDLARAMFEVWSGASFAGDLGRIRAPTHVAAGAADPYLSPDLVRVAVAEAIPGARFTVIEGAGHYPQLDRPVQVAGWIGQAVRA